MEPSALRDVLMPICLGLGAGVLVGLEFVLILKWIDGALVQQNAPENDHLTVNPGDRGNAASQEWRVGNPGQKVEEPGSKITHARRNADSRSKEHISVPARSSLETNVPWPASSMEAITRYAMAYAGHSGALSEYNQIRSEESQGLPRMGIRILVVEDEELIAASLVQGLREEGFAVERAADGGEAWTKLQAGSWDLVLLDWWLPVQDGVTILRRLRQRDRETRVLLLTARDSVVDRVVGLDAGADDYLCKPFAFEELLARVRALMRRQTDRADKMLTFEDVTVDLKTQRAERAGKLLDLTAKEYSLLVFFLAHPREVLTRTRIYEHVWDERYDGRSNTLEVHVVELRRKLEAYGGRLIHTLRGRGYAFGQMAYDDQE